MQHKPLSLQAREAALSGHKQLMDESHCSFMVCVSEEMSRLVASVFLEWFSFWMHYTFSFQMYRVLPTSQLHGEKNFQNVLSARQQSKRIGD